MGNYFKEFEKRIQNLNLTWPLFFVGLTIFFVPLIVYLKIVFFDGVLLEKFGRPNSVNFFTFYKSVWLQIFIGSSLLFFFAKGNRESIFYPKTLVLLAYLTILSAIFSDYAKLAFWGDPTRHEGLITQFCYLSITFLAINLLREMRQIRFVQTVLLASAAIIGTIGILQFFGYDFFFGGFADKYLVPTTFKELIPDFSVSSMTPAPGGIAVTFGNGNYTGSYMAMIWAISFGILVGAKAGVSYPMIFLNLLAFANLLGSRSRAGMIGAFAAILFFVFIYRRLFFKRKVFVLFVAYSATFVLMDVASIDSNDRLIKGTLNKPISSPKRVFGNFEDLKLGKDFAEVTFDGIRLKIKNSSGNIEFIGPDDVLVPHRLVKKEDFLHDINSKDSKFEDTVTVASNDLETGKALGKIVADDKISRFDEEKFLVLFPENKLRGYVIFAWPEKNLLQIRFCHSVNFFLWYTEDRGFQLLNPFGKPVTLKNVESLGFEGYERWGSGRGYIWSRSLPLIKKALFIGFGPDTFAAYFPNDDFLGKLRFVGKGIHMMMDKPHNMYIQMAVQTGLLSMMVFVFFITKTILESIKLGFSGGVASSERFAFTGAIIAYMVAGIFNDSVIAVAPVFWCILGCNFALNRIESKISVVTN